MDVTHIPSFKNTPLVHVSIDTYSGFVCASSCMGKASDHVISHCLYAFSIMGTPKIIKTENGSGYMSQAFQHFCSTFRIQHIMGIPYKLQGQSMVGRTHLTLKKSIV